MDGLECAFVSLAVLSFIVLIDCTSLKLAGQRIVSPFQVLPRVTPAAIDRARKLHAPVGPLRDPAR